LVWGHHPHVVQGIEVYQGTPIFYSLGNLVFDQMWSKETREGLVLEVYFWNDMLVEAKLLPVFMNDFAQPDWQATGVGSVVLGRVEKYSYGLGEN
jgi:poly-gamma-glutamate synthesis protein (capsule biosynthesis protein)